MAELSDSQLEEVYSFAVQLGKDAGDMLMLAARRRFDGQGETSASVSYVEKDNSVDIVTATDNGESATIISISETYGTNNSCIEVEAFIHKSIQAKFPSHKFVSRSLVDTDID